MRLVRNDESSPNHYKDSERLIVEPVKKPTHLLELLAPLEPIEDAFPDVDVGLPALDNVRL